jgi:hypothetical protein
VVVGVVLLGVFVGPAPARKSKMDPVPQMISEYLAKEML